MTERLPQKYINILGIMVCLGIIVVILHCIDTADTYQPDYCHKVAYQQKIPQ